MHRFRSYVLPNACETALYLSCNLRELINMSNERLCRRARWEIRELVEKMVSLVDPELPSCSSPSARAAGLFAMKTVEVLTMINTRGEWIYTNAEIAYELGLSPATVNAIGKKLYGVKIPHWNAIEVRRIIQYIKSISIEEDEKRLQVLRDIVAEEAYVKQNDEEVRKNVGRDLHNVRG